MNINMTESELNAIFETVVFAKSEQEQPSPRMVAAVNELFRLRAPVEGQSPETAVRHREMAVQRISSGLINDLSKSELGKAENALMSIAETLTKSGD